MKIAVFYWIKEELSTEHISLRMDPQLRTNIEDVHLSRTIEDRRTIEEKN